MFFVLFKYKHLNVFPCGSAGKESACNEGDLGSIPELERSPGEGEGYPLQYSGLENSVDSPWGCKESDTTERLSLSLSYGGSEVSWLIQGHPAKTKPGFRLSIFLVKYGLFLRSEYTLEGPLLYMVIQTRRLLLFCNCPVLM